MGFWSGLGKGLGIIGGVAAAPFTGGASLIPSILSAGGAVASGIAGGRAQGQHNENQDDLQYARANMDIPSMRARNSVQGDILANVQPVSINGPITGTHGKMPEITGGLSPALLSQNTRQLGQGMSRDALLQQMQGPMTPNKGNAFDHVLEGVGYAGLLGGTMGTLPQRQQPMPPDTDLENQYGVPPMLQPPYGGGARGR